MKAARVVRAREFCAPHAWSALPRVAIGGVTARLQWTNRPYRWHVNDGAEVFAVRDGVGDMHYRAHGREYLVTLGSGGVLCAQGGCEHVARPRAAARIRVVEREASQ
jgi:mannose-6-phosphate isomerase-like protein (cupin superfamily)